MRTTPRPGADFGRSYADGGMGSPGSDLSSGGLLSPTFRTLLLVAEAGSFSTAARMLGVCQSTVSRQVQELEDRIGVSLFERQGAGTRPTDAGRQLLMRLSEVRGLARTAVSEARDFGAVLTGRLRLGFTGSFVTAPARDILGRLRELHPRLKVQLAEHGTSVLVRQVLSHELDCAWVASWRSPDPVLVFEPLWSEPLYLAVPASQPCSDAVTWVALSGQVLLARPEAELDLLFPVLEKAGVSPPEVQLHDCSRESLIALVAEGHGVAIMPESFAHLGRAGVRFVQIDEPTAAVAVSVMYRRDRDNPALRRLLAITRDWLRANQARPVSPSGLA
jgi:DNA-binding transcriptional LysR family regulator